MKCIIIDGQLTGASGDMFLGALLDLQFKDESDIQKADKKRVELANKLAKMVIKAAGLEGKAKLEIDLERKNIRAIEGLNVKITLEEPHRHLHAPQAFDIVEKTADLLELSTPAKKFSKKAIEILFEAESKAHGEPIDKVHLHEAGSLDTFLDVLGAAYLLDKLDLFSSKYYILPLAIGSGTVTFSHGTLPVPAPAVAEIIKKYKLPVTIGNIKSELLTPTGAIIVASLLQFNTSTFVKGSPSFTLETIGVGFGTKEFEKSPNCLRLFVGEDFAEEYPREVISIIETNLDDCSGEIIGYLTKHLMKLGAKDVYLTPIYMKKGRPAIKISVLCDPKDEMRFSTEILNQTSTIGVRISQSTKIMLKREYKDFTIKLNGKDWKFTGKIAYGTDGQVVHFKPEFEDVREIAEENNMPVIEVITLARKEIASKIKK
ncbi:MAG: nickel pincer cofactor biosynthesis protein LarC [Candidatus Heimdallarchaeota archaeon]